MSALPNRHRLDNGHNKRLSKIVRLLNLQSHDLELRAVLALFCFRIMIIPIDTTFISNYIFLRYCPPTSYKALEICPKLATRTVSINSANIFPPEAATSFKRVNASSTLP